METIKGTNLMDPCVANNTIKRYQWLSVFSCSIMRQLVIVSIYIPYCEVRKKIELTFKLSFEQIKKRNSKNAELSLEMELHKCVTNLTYM